MASHREHPTMADVARSAGVSVMTVSYCYNRPERVADATRQRVRDAAQQLGYRGPDPTARSLRRGRVGSIGVVLGEHLTYAFEDPQARRFLAGVASVCVEHGAGMTLIPTRNLAEGSARIPGPAVDGLIVWTTTADDPALAAATALGRPVAVHGGPAVAGTDVVSIDNRAAARAIAEVVFAGARRPAVLSFPLDSARSAGLVAAPAPADVAFPVTAERLSGVYGYCADAGVPLADLTVAVSGRNDRTSARGVIDDLLDAPSPPDAVLAMSDELAIAALDAVAARRLGVPDDIAVSGWDDGPEAEAAGLTTVSQSLFEQGRQCTRIALGEAADPDPSSWHVVQRASTR